MNRLSVRLLASHALVVVMGAAVAYVVGRLIVPGLYDRRAHGGGHMGRGAGRETGAVVRDAALGAMNTALLVGLLAGILMALALATYSTVRILRPLRAVRHASRRMADGDYGHRIPLPQEQELAAVAADVNQLGSRLAETEGRRVRLLSEVAHEMRTPLTVLEGYVEGMLDGVFTPGPEVLTECSDELRQLRRLSEDLSALSRAEEGRLDLRLEDLDLADVTARAAERLRPQFEDSGVDLRVHTTHRLPVRADGDRLAQVVTNLLGNALAATGRGGQVTVQAVAAGDRATVAVHDDGVGLAPQHLDRVFERFYRVVGTERRSGGTGIGLTIAREIARAHGGDLRAASPGPGQGAVFTLELPLLPHGVPTTAARTGGDR